MIHKLYRENFSIYDPSAAINPFWFITFGNFLALPLLCTITVAGETGGTASLEDMPRLVTMMLTLIPVALVLYLIPAYDNIIRWTVDFVTTGDIHKPHLIGGIIFGSAYKELSINSSFYESQTLYHRLGGINTLLVFPLQLLVWILAFPSIIPFVIGILSVIGLAAIVLCSARKIYTLSKKLSSHINDPDAHKKD